MRSPVVQSVIARTRLRRKVPFRAVKLVRTKPPSQALAGRSQTSHRFSSTQFPTWRIASSAIAAQSAAASRMPIRPPRDDWFSLQLLTVGDMLKTCRKTPCSSTRKKTWSVLSATARRAFGNERHRDGLSAHRQFSTPRGPRMRKALFAILTGSVAMIPQMAQAQQQAPAAAPMTTNPAQPSVSSTASLADCDRLLVVLEQKRPANPGITAEQVQAYKTGNNPQACRDALMRVDPDSVATKTEGGTNVVVQQPAPSIQVEQAAPQVTVQQPQPQVTVRQPQPEIIVRQPAPTVTVDIPQPEIMVRTPKPEVNVAMAQPQVQVNQPPPNVQVTQPQQPQVQVQPGQPQVNLQQTGPSANVQVQENNTPPTVRYERAEPKVTVNQAQGQPQVRMESADARPQGAPESATSEPRTTGARTDQGLTVARLK